jgi:ubiquitin carboxyl-terminal hydrolase 2/21
MCAKCKQKRPCTKKLSIQKCPDILVLHLKRFSQMRGRTKLDTHVDFPITNLRLTGLTDVMSESHEGKSSKENKINFYLHTLGPVPTYNLFGISNHSGTVYTGHYTAECKHPFTHEWHEFNDSSVHLITDNSRIISANAYVLFYERN